MTIQEQLYTIEDFEAYENQHPEQLVELIDGRIVEKVTTEEHGVIAGIIIAEIRLFLKQNPHIKGYAGVEISHRRPEDKYNDRKPDVSFRATDGKVSKAGILMQMPDFAVEIKSPTNGYDELRDKARFYIANGTRLVWLVYPTKQIIEVYLADGSSDLFKADETLDGGDVLPGFQLAVATIFEMTSE
jgi:Uma2 family endonuclease